jgi:phosphatidylinositol alpha-1,6-mannosyltransferase
MIDAMVLINKRLPEARWIVVGDGGLRKDLERYSSERGIAHKITFVGAVRDDERERWLDRAHVFAMPSRIESDGEVEGYGLVYLEAGAHSLPVVAGNVAGARDAVQQGKTGLLVEPTDPVAVADAISKLLDDGELREQLGKEGRSKADRQTWALFAERVEQTLHEAISETRR